MATGWVKIYRSLSECKSASRGIEYIGAMVWLISNANHDQSYYKGDLINRGEIAVGRLYLSEQWNTSIQTARTIINNLKNDEFLTIKSTNKGTIITIVNYDTYQGSELENQPSNQPTTSQRLTTNKNDKNINTREYIAHFEQFWTMYDLKTDRKKCESVFAKLKEDEIKKIFEVLPSYIARTDKERSPNSKKTYRKNPLTWLNGKCWNDEVIKSSDVGSEYFDKMEKLMKERNKEW